LIFDLEKRHRVRGLDPALKDFIQEARSVLDSKPDLVDPIEPTKVLGHGLGERLGGLPKQRNTLEVGCL
jgi:hypothetical protein